MKNVFKKVTTCLLIFIFTVFVAVPVSALSDLESLNKTVKEEKLLLGDKNISWIDNKDNSTEYFYGKEYGADNYYKITWDGQATKVANPYSDTTQPAFPTLPVAGGKTYTTTVGQDGASIDIKSNTGDTFNVSMSKLATSITGNPSSGSGTATPGQAVTDVIVLGELDGEVYFAVKSNGKYYLVTGQGELFYNTPIEGADGTNVVIGYVTAGRGIVLVKGANGAKVISFGGNEVASGDDISVSRFGFIGVEYKDTASDGSTQKHTKVLSFEGTTLLTGRTGQLAHYVASTVHEDNTSSDYLKDGSHIFTVVDPYTSTTCHYKLVITSTNNPAPNPENPSTATGQGEMTLTLTVAALAVGAIYIASRKLKRDF